MPGARWLGNAISYVHSAVGRCSPAPLEYTFINSDDHDYEPAPTVLARSPR